jgi:hypothetical protein
MQGLGTAKDPFAAYSWILAASKPAITAAMNIFRLCASLDQQKLARPRSTRFHWNNKARK